DLTRYIVSGARDIDVEPVIEPVMNVVALKVKEPAKVRQDLMSLGWHVSMTREPHRALRLILMSHITRENIDLFLQDLDAVLQSGG
ncbi:MAG: tyrosine decarboxylase MfnA, partial [Methanotrichaceae archaeon]